MPNTTNIAKMDFFIIPLFLLSATTNSTVLSTAILYPQDLTVVVIGKCLYNADEYSAECKELVG